MENTVPAGFMTIFFGRPKSSADTIENDRKTFPYSLTLGTRARNLSGETGGGLFLFFVFQEIFRDAVKTDQNPQGFDDEGGEIEAVKKRKNDQARAERVQKRIKQAFAFEALGLQQNVCQNNRPDADRTDHVVPGERHKNPAVLFIFLTTHRI
jgi:hypothetical protein